MNPIQIQVKQSYYIRMSIVMFFTVVPGLVIATTGIPDRPLFIVVGLFFICFSPALLYFQRRRWVKTLDDVGVTRQDGKKFLWLDLIKIEHIYAYTKSGSRYFNHIEIKFKEGKALVFPLVLNNGAEILGILEKISAEEPKKLNERKVSYF